MRIFWVGFDAKKGPFQDLRVRRAVAHAIDRQTMAKELMGVSTQLLDVPCYPTQFGCIGGSDAPKYGYDVQKAKSLLAEAGLPNGFDTSMVIYAQGPNRTLAEALQGYLRAVGIKVAINVTSIKGFFEAVQEGKVPLKLESYGQYNINDVAILLPEYFGGGSLDSVGDVQITQWLKEAGATGDVAKRKALYQQSARQIVDKSYWVPLFIQSVNYAFAKDFDFRAWPDENPRFYLAKWK
jgi:peptide/nickel transport system substrate-binding protein